MLTNSLINNNVRKEGKLWMKNLAFCILQNFKKIRVNSKVKSKPHEIDTLLEKRKSIDVQSRSAIEEDIANKIYERNRDIIIEQVGGMVDTACNLSRIKMWKIKEKVCPKNDVPYPVAKLNQDGVLVSNKFELKSLYVNTYKERLKHRQMRPGYENLKELKESLFNWRLKLSKLRKTNCWTDSDLLKVTKQMKNNKAADPKGLISEIFKPGVAGSDLFQSLLLLCNKVKEECEIPAFMEWTNISSLYKHRGLKSDLNNDRGIFNVIRARSIIDNLVCNDYYQTIDESMSDSNVGGRKERNIRDNLLML